MNERDFRVNQVLTEYLPRLQAADQGSWNKVLTMLQESLVSYARRIVRNYEDADEAVQSAMWNVTRAVTGGSQEKLEVSYFLRAVRNACFRILKDRGKRPVTSLSPEGANESDIEIPDKCTPNQVDMMILNDLLNSLPDEEKQVVTLHLIESRTFPEIDEQLKLVSGRAATIYYRARNRLRKACDEEEDNHG